LLGIDHITITVSDLAATCAFYDKLFGAEQTAQYPSSGPAVIRQIIMGGALLSIHQAESGFDNPLVAKRATVGSADFCFRWASSLESAVALLREHGIEMIGDPSPGRTADGRLPAHSIYFRDPDGNLLELKAAD
jgi:catechol 2,3-dioxygenase-like lactoylglutathione lyase family enzyme